MKTIKFVCLTLIIVLCAAFGFACEWGGSIPETPGGKENAKPVDGSPILFDETMDFYNTDPSVIIEGEVKYIFYTVNSEAQAGKATIAVRKATKSEGAWVYGEKKTVITPSNEGFDSFSASNADVIKGVFKYKGQTYSYLMAYQGCENTAAKNHKIGFAVANQADGEWVKVENLLIESAVTTAYGVAQPSLISYDKAGKVVVCYSHDWGTHTSQMFREMIAEDLSNPVLGVENGFATNGLKEGDSLITFNNADFAYDSESGYLYVVRDYNPAAAKGCKLNTAVQVAKILFKDVFSTEAKWSIVEDKVDWRDLRDANDAEKLGWVYVYSACIQADEYGQVNGAESFDLAITVTSYDQETFEYLYYQTITECVIEL